MLRRALTAALALAATSAAESYRGTEVAPERRCARYDRADYRYFQSLEARIVARSARSTVAAAEAVLSDCDATAMEMVECAAVASPARRLPTARTDPSGEVDPLALWDHNGNGRITCAEARRHGITPVQRGRPAYRFMRDGDGVVCE